LFLTAVIAIHPMPSILAQFARRENTLREDDRSTHISESGTETYIPRNRVPRQRRVFPTYGRQTCICQALALGSDFYKGIKPEISSTYKDKDILKFGMAVPTI
jgi:hypothetical protein